MDITAGPNDQDPPWSDGPDDPDTETCAGCGTENEAPLGKECAGCGFNWHQIEAAKKSVNGVCRALGVDPKTLDTLKFRAAMDAVLGEWVAPE
jgi:hypothetical protein